MWKQTIPVLLKYSSEIYDTRFSIALYNKSGDSQFPIFWFSSEMQRDYVFQI